MLDQKKLDSLLAGCRFWEKVQCFETVDSTNLIVKGWARQGAEEGRCAVAEAQTAGRGRRGRSWISPPGENLYFSILLRPQAEASHVAMITLLMAIAVTQGVRELHLDAKIKWPNDVVVNGKKICGILTEMYQSVAGSFFLVIGTGINVNQKEFLEEVKKTADSLALELGADVDREVLLASVLRHFLDCYDSFLETMDLSGQKELYESFLVNKGRVVEVLDPKGEWQGTAIGIEKTGELLVQRKDGSVEAVYAGEVSVRGIYGYV